MSFAKIKKSFSESAIHPAVGLKFFVICMNIALPFPIFGFSQLYYIGIKKSYL